MDKQTGFTLIEVLVALIIVAVSLAALSSSLGQYVFQQGALEKRVMGTWVAQNRLVEIQQSQGTSSSLQKDKAYEALNATWNTELTFQPTLIPNIQKTSIQVSLDGEKYPAASLITVVGK